MKNGRKTVGILGGMGPLASAHFLSLVVSHTLAERDSDHIDTVMTSRASTPDRTAHLLGKSPKNPLDTMKIDVDTLIFGGADMIAVPCNTAMAYYEELSLYSAAPILNIVSLTVGAARAAGIKKLSLLATEGTVTSKIYQKECERSGILCAVPDEPTQSVINDIIYQKIKAGAYKVNEIYPIIDGFLLDSDAVVFGCTELSLIDLSGFDKKDYIIDSSRVLAMNAIKECGGTPVGFSEVIWQNSPKFRACSAQILTKNSAIAKSTL